MLGWPDRGVPKDEDMKYLFEIIERLIEERKRDNTPIFIHCSAGVGRTGTFIALYFLIELAIHYRESGEDGGFSIFGTVRNLREQRMLLVKTLEQYKFLYRALSEYLNNYSNHN